jgi:UDP-glucuronate 4-epimerase
VKILITGAAGFIGFHVTKKLLQRGDHIVGIDNINDYYDVSLKYARLADTGISNDAENWHLPVQSSAFPGYSFIRMNLEDRNELTALFEKEKFDKVCHLAAQAGVRYSLENPYAYIGSNLVGFINIIEACRHNSIKHLVYASSSSVYGNNTKMPLSTSDNVDHPISLYAATKKSNELIAHTYSHLFGLPTTGLRFFTVYGPWGRPDMALFLFTKAILDNKPIQVFNNGNMVRDFTYIDDIVEGITRVLDNEPRAESQGQRAKGREHRAKSMEHGAKSRGQGAESIELRVENNQQLASPEAPYKIYNIGNSSPIPLMDYIAAIEARLGKTAEKIYLPMQPGDVPRTEADVTDLIENMGYKPDTTVEVGIGRFLEWYQTFFNDKNESKKSIITTDYTK